MENIIKTLAVILRTAVPDVPENAVLTEATLLNELGLSEMELVLFAMAVEDNFDIRFTGAPSAKTLGDIAKYILEYPKTANA